ncbi:UNVERIFIED_ORG: Mce-associated membrane protein [Gordonia westfalica J30]
MADKKPGPDKGRLGLIVLAVLVVAALAATTFLGYRYIEGRSVEDARESSLAAARDYANTMFGYNAENVSDHIDQSMSVLTGPAKPEYTKLITENNLAAEVRKQQVVSEVTIQDAGVVTNTADTSKVLIFMNQSVTRGQKELVSINPSRLTFNMELQGDRWMINNIEVITDDTFRSKLEVVESLPPDAKPLPGQSPAPSQTPSAPPAAPAPGSDAPAVPVP